MLSKKRESVTLIRMRCLLQTCQWLVVVDAEEDIGRWCCWSWTTDTCSWSVSSSVCSVVRCSSLFCMRHARLYDCSRVFWLLWVSTHKKPADCLLYWSASSLCISCAVVVRNEEKEAWFVLHLDCAECTSVSSAMHYKLNIFGLKMYFMNDIVQYSPHFYCAMLCIAWTMLSHYVCLSVSLSVCPSICLMSVTPVLCWYS